MPKKQNKKNRKIVFETPVTNNNQQLTKLLALHNETAKKAKFDRDVALSQKMFENEWN